MEQGAEPQVRPGSMCDETGRCCDVRGVGESDAFATALQFTGCMQKFSNFPFCLQVFSRSTFYGLCLFCVLLRFKFHMNLVEVIFCFYLFSRKKCLLKRSTSHILLKKALKKQTHNNLSCVRCSDKALSERYGTFKLCSKT